METKTIDYASSLKEASTPSLLSLMFLESYFALTSGYRYLHWIINANCSRGQGLITNCNSLLTEQRKTFKIIKRRQFKKKKNLNVKWEKLMKHSYVPAIFSYKKFYHCAYDPMLSIPPFGWLSFLIWRNKISSNVVRMPSIYTIRFMRR